LTIGQASLTAGIANQTKTYGADDPAVGTITPVLSGLINRTVSTYNGNVGVDDSTLTSTTTSLVRQTGEDVGVRNITSGVFSAASANYSAPTLSGTPTLTINQASLTAGIANQTKTYGADDPAVVGITPVLSGLINRTVSTYNGNVGVDDSALTSTTTSLVRQTGEDVGVRNITSGAFSAASANYSAPTLSGTPTLTIGQALLTVTADDKTRPANSPNPPFSASYTGFRFRDGPEDLEGSLAFATPALNASPPGNYRITPFGLTGTNYSVIFVDGTLTVGAPDVSATVGLSSLLGSLFTAVQPRFDTARFSLSDFLSSLPTTSAGPSAGRTGASGTGASEGRGEGSGDGRRAADASRGGSGTIVVRVSSTVAVGGCGINSPEGGC
jgi:hypothetical protein